MGWAAAVPEKNADKTASGTNKFLLNLVSGGAAAAIVKTAFCGNFASVARYAPSQALNFAFFDLYNNSETLNSYYGDKWKMFVPGGLAGITTLGITQYLEHAFKRPAAPKVGTRRDREWAFGARSGKEAPVNHLVKKIRYLKAFNELAYPLTVTFFHRALYFGLYDATKVAVASDDQKLNLFSACALAMTTTSIANFCSYPVHIMAQILMRKPEHKELNAQFFNKHAILLTKEGWYANVKCGNYYTLNVISYTKLLFKKAIYSKQFAFRCAAGALMLAGYDEIQKWLH